jgi:flagellar biosynthesis/type III secretory pathway M-ring protein FliF/YscJ
MILPDMELILSYVFNAILIFLIYFFIFRPLIKSVKLTLDKLSATKSQQTQYVAKTEQNTKEDIEREKREKIKKQNEEILKQTEKELEEMESKVIANLLSNKK